MSHRCIAREGVRR